MTSDASDFYASLPVFDNFADAVKPKSLSSAARRLGRRLRRRRRLDHGRSRKAATRRSTWSARARSPPSPTRSNGGRFPSSSAATARASRFADGCGGRRAGARRDGRLRPGGVRAGAPGRRRSPSATSARPGRDVRIARFAASAHCVYAMFTGGGLTWFEEQAKRGGYALPPAPPGALPDLSGLSCRWGVAPAKYGLVLSLIVAPRGDDPRFPALVDEIVAMALAEAQSGRPVTVESLGLGAPGPAIALEASVNKASGASRVKAQARRRGELSHGRDVPHVQAEGRRLRRGPLRGRSRRQRRFPQVRRRAADDARLLARIRRRARGAARPSPTTFADWGLYRQKAAQVTCFVPSITEHGHVHFVDGADGGYTMAATAMKARRLLKTAKAA